MRTVVLLLLFTLVPASLLAQDDPVASFADALSTDAALRKLEQGKAITGSFDLETKPRSASIWGAIRIPASPQAIIKLIRDCPNAPRYHKKLKFCEIISSDEVGDGDDDEEILHQQLKISWFSPLLDYTFRAKYNDNAIRYTLISGDLKILQGGWNVYPDPGANSGLLVYFISIKPAAPVPLWVVTRVLQSDIIKTLQTMRELLSLKGNTWLTDE
ncbi:MAG: hypothetical protein L3J24_03820 [Xanthomonadales bacterium]|nr:hypothetical protein [Xanthomonadales bacterium]